MKIRPAHVADARTICGLVNYYAERGRMLHRSLESVYQDLREFLVADEAGHVVGCVAVGIYWADLAEIKSLAVGADQRGKGIGGRLVKAAVASAKKLGIKKLFALTYEKDFFARQGFEVIDRDRLPEKVWQVCIYCPKADACDEIAMMMPLRPKKVAAKKVRKKAAKRKVARKAKKRH